MPKKQLPGSPGKCPLTQGRFHEWTFEGHTCREMQALVEMIKADMQEWLKKHWHWLGTYHYEMLTKELQDMEMRYNFELPVDRADNDEENENK